MKSWLSSPAVELVAKKCCVCGHPLLDAESVASGIGPICAEKTMAFRPGLDPDVRAEVNRLVYELAAYQAQVEAIPRINRLRALGFGNLADRIFERIGARLLQRVSIRIEKQEGTELLALSLPWMSSDLFAKVLSDMRNVPGWHVVKDGQTKTSRIPNRTPSIHALYRVLSKHFEGEVAQSPKGLFIVPSVKELESLLPKPREAAA